MLKGVRKKLQSNPYLKSHCDPKNTSFWGSEHKLIPNIHSKGTRRIHFVRYLNNNIKYSLRLYREGESAPYILTPTENENFLNSMIFDSSSKKILLIPGHLTYYLSSLTMLTTHQAPCTWGWGYKAGMAITGLSFFTSLNFFKCLQIYQLSGVISRFSQLSSKGNPKKTAI